MIKTSEYFEYYVDKNGYTLSLVRAISTFAASRANMCGRADDGINNVAAMGGTSRIIRHYFRIPEWIYIA